MTRRGIALLALGLVSCTGSTGPAGLPGDVGVGESGEQGEPGLPAAPVISAIVPNEVYRGRDVEVLISGAGTDWGSVDDLTVDFGEGIEVDAASLHLASPTALNATIRIAADAPRGLRNVSVSNGAADPAQQLARYENSFSVDAPIRVGGFLNGGLSAQGSLFLFSVTVNDPATVFSPNGPELVVYPEGGSARLAPQLGVQVGPLSLEPKYTEYLMPIDVHAPPGFNDIVIENGPEGFVETSVEPNALVVSERTPLPMLEFDTTSTVKIWRESMLFELTTSEASIVNLDLATDYPPSGTWAFVLPESGRWDEAIVFGNTFDLTSVRFLSVGAKTFYVVLWNDTNKLDYDVHVWRTTTPITFKSLSLQSPHLDVIQFGEPDVYKLTLAKDAILDVSLSDGNINSCFGFPSLEARVVLLDTDGNKILGGIQGPCPSFQVPIPENGDYYLEVAPPPWCPSCDFDYTITIALL